MAQGEFRYSQPPSFAETKRSIVAEFEKDFYKAVANGDTFFWYLSPDGPKLVRHSAQHTTSDQDTATLNSILQSSSTTAESVGSTDSVRTPDDSRGFMSALRLRSPQFVPRNISLDSSLDSRKRGLGDVFTVEPGLRQIGLRIFCQSSRGLRRWCWDVNVGKTSSSVESWIRHRYNLPRMKLATSDGNIYSGIVSDYILNRRHTEYDFWTRTTGSQIKLECLTDSLRWHYRIVRPETLKPLKVQIRCINPNSSSPPEASDLLIGIAGKWHPLIKWIEQQIDTCPASGVSMWEWWAWNGLTFRFMDLPAELRLNVYEKLSGKYTWPHTTFQSPDLGIKTGLYFYDDTENLHFLTSQWIREILLDPGLNPAPTLTRLLLGSRILAEEFWEHTCHHTVKHFAASETLLRTIPRMEIDHLRRVSLGFSNADYFFLLGYRSSLSDAFISSPTSPLPPLFILANISTLDQLSLHFQTGLFDPWVDISTGLGRRKQFSCQSIFVDWFLSIGFPHLRTIPRISLLGHVKDSTRTTWKKIFNDEREGRRHDLSGKVATILSTPRLRVPPACTCFHPCDWSDQYGPYTKDEVDRAGSNDRMPPLHSAEYDPRKHDRFICED